MSDESVPARSKAEAFLDERCPPGWDREFVEPPWKGQPGRCRSCGLVQATSPSEVRWSITTMLRFDEQRKVMRFSFAMVCSDCIKDEQRMKLMADRVFGLQAPPADDGDVSKSEAVVNEKG